MRARLQTGLVFFRASETSRDDRTAHLVTEVRADSRWESGQLAICRPLTPSRQRAWGSPLPWTDHAATRLELAALLDSGRLTSREYEHAVAVAPSDPLTPV